MSAENSLGQYNITSKMVSHLMRWENYIIISHWYIQWLGLCKHQQANLTIVQGSSKIQLKRVHDSNVVALAATIHAPINPILHTYTV